MYFFQQITVVLWFEVECPGFPPHTVAPCAHSSSAGYIFDSYLIYELLKTCILKKQVNFLENKYIIKAPQYKWASLR